MTNRFRTNRWTHCPRPGRPIRRGRRDWVSPPRGKRLAPKNDGPAVNLTAQQRLLLLDTWRRSGLPAGDFAALVGLSKHTLYAWKRKFEAEGPAGLEDKPRGGPHGSRLPGCGGDPQCLVGQMSAFAAADLLTQVGLAEVEDLLAHRLAGGEDSAVVQAQGGRSLAGLAMHGRRRGRHRKGGEQLSRQELTGLQRLDRGAERRATGVGGAMRGSRAEEVEQIHS